MTGLLEGKVAIVTGGVGGIGLASAEKFLAEGGKVVIADIQDDLGARTAERLGDDAAYWHTDVSDEAAVEALVAHAVDRFGRLDIMYNNAGIVGDPSSMTEIGPKGFDTVMNLDVNSVLYGHKHAARQFARQGGGGSIITTASIAGMQGGWSTIAYTAAKHAVAGIVHQAAYELGPQGIRSNAVAPGVVMTDIQARAFGVPLERAREFNQFIVDRIGSQQAMGRFAVPADIANVTAFLASDLSGYVNGLMIPVDGGASAMTQSSFAKDILEVRDAFIAR